MRQRLRRLTWIALTAMLALALVPTLSHALAFARGQSDLANVCSAQGTRLVATDDESPSPSGATFDHVDQCPLCSLQAASLALPPAADDGVAPLKLSHAVPALFLAAPRLLFAWSAAQPRGPPAFS
ncbi:MAG TPA: DUF2946 domain-containing protein [Albitalea sp.]|nr:DUF2946 domain-containing protein [Albitalea sp.]